MIRGAGSSLHLASVVVVIIGELLSMIGLLQVFRLTCARSEHYEEDHDCKYNPLEHNQRALLICRLKRIRSCRLEALAVGEFTTAIISVTDVLQGSKHVGDVREDVDADIGDFAHCVLVYLLGVV